MNKLTNIVRECLDQHQGGEEFFDALDIAIQDKQIIKQLELLVVDDLTKKGYDIKDIGIIVSGKFGEFYAENIGLDPSSLYVTSGSLRNYFQDHHLNMDSSNIPKKWIFIDDSIYSGNTKEVIRKALKDLDCILLHTFVIYDGSINKSLLISSLYRFYK
jgi:adenine/guanine phosphoribosyltransferase-like PRPP-binding protein